MSIYGNYINEKSKIFDYYNNEEDRESIVMTKKEYEEYIRKNRLKQNTIEKANQHPGIVIYDKKYNNSTETDDIE